MSEFTMKFNEREMSIIQDALDLVAEQHEHLTVFAWATTTFEASDFGNMAAQVAERLAY
jgi:hypothetical protein